MAITTINFGIGGSSTGGIIGVGGMPKSDADNVSSSIDIDGVVNRADVTMEGALTNDKILAGQYDMSTKLSPHFTLNQLCKCACTSATPIAQCNWSKNEIVMNLRDVAVNILEPIYSNICKNFLITSGLRSSVNSGSSKSQHLQGQAVDLQFPGQCRNVNDYCAMAAKIHKTLPTYSQLIIEYGCNAPAVIHVAYGDSRLGSVRKNSHQLRSSPANGQNSREGIWTASGASGHGRSLAKKVFG